MSASLPGREGKQKKPRNEAEMVQGWLLAENVKKKKKRAPQSVLRKRKLAELHMTMFTPQQTMAPFLDCSQKLPSVALFRFLFTFFQSSVLPLLAFVTLQTKVSETVSPPKKWIPRRRLSNLLFRCSWDKF